MKRTTTLIAEDEPLASEGLAGWVREIPELELVGIRADGPGTLQALRTLAPELVLMDIHMPGMGGIETVERLRTSNCPSRDTPVIALTADVVSRRPQEYLDLGFNDFVAKPILVSGLISAIRRAANCEIPAGQDRISRRA